MIHTSGQAASLHNHTPPLSSCGIAAVLLPLLSHMQFWLTPAQADVLVNESGPDASPHFFAGGPGRAGSHWCCSTACHALLAACHAPASPRTCHPCAGCHAAAAAGERRCPGGSCACPKASLGAPCGRHAAGMFQCIPAMSRMAEGRLLDCFKTGGGIRWEGYQPGAPAVPPRLQAGAGATGSRSCLPHMND